MTGPAPAINGICSCNFCSYELTFKYDIEDPMPAAMAVAGMYKHSLLNRGCASDGFTTTFQSFR